MTNLRSIIQNIIYIVYQHNSLVSTGSQIDGHLVFELTRLLEPSERFRPQEDWKFKASLVKRDGGWALDGLIDSTPGFERITLKPIESKGWQDENMIL